MFIIYVYVYFYECANLSISAAKVMKTCTSIFSYEFSRLLFFKSVVIIVHNQINPNAEATYFKRPSDLTKTNKIYKNERIV